MKWHMKIFFEPRDLWVGVFIKEHRLWWDIYICPLPCLVVHIFQAVTF